MFKELTKLKQIYINQKDELTKKSNTLSTHIYYFGKLFIYHKNTII